MQANWSLILNVVLLVIVVVAIRRLMKAQRQQQQSNTPAPQAAKTSPSAEQNPYDDIIAVRKVNGDPFDILTSDDEPTLSVNPEPQSSAPSLELPVDEAIEAAPVKKVEPVKVKREAPALRKTDTSEEKASSLMMFLLAKGQRHLAGYELLQTVLAAGLRYGEGQLFHRHQHANGQGPVLCSLAAATASGTFDLHNIGAFSARGLCLFMQASGNPAIDAERFNIMLDTAKQLSEGLDTLLLDDLKRPLTNERLGRYHRLLNIQEGQGIAVA